MLNFEKCLECYSPIWCDVEEKTLACPFKCDRPEVNISLFLKYFVKSHIKGVHCKPKEQCDHDKVGEEGSEPDNLPRRVETLSTHLVNIRMAPYLEVQATN